MRDDLRPGNKFPDIELPNQDKEMVKLSSLIRGFPTIVVSFHEAIIARKIGASWRTMCSIYSPGTYSRELTVPHFPAIHPRPYYGYDNRRQRASQHLGVGGINYAALRLKTVA